MPILKKFCFCLSLRTGGIILGLFHLICTLLGIVTFAMTAKLAMMLGSYRRDTMALDAEPAPIEDSDYEEVWGGLVGFLSVCLTLIIASSLLITGAVKRRRKYLIPHLVLDALRCIGMAVLLGYVLYNGKTASAEGSYLLLGTSVIQVYLFICTYSLFQHIRDEKKQKLVQHYVQVQQPPSNLVAIYPSLKV